MVWHLQGSGLPKSLYGVQHTCYCPIFCGPVSHARSDWEGFLCAGGWGAPPPYPRAVLSRVLVLVFGWRWPKALGLLLKSRKLAIAVTSLWAGGTKVARKRWGPSLCPAPSLQPPRLD